MLPLEDGRGLVDGRPAVARVVYVQRTLLAGQARVAVDATLPPGAVDARRHHRAAAAGAAARRAARRLRLAHQQRVARSDVTRRRRHQRTCNRWRRR